MSERTQSENLNCSLSGELTIYTAREQIKALIDLLKKDPETIALDLSEVTEMDTAGLQLLLWLNKTCREMKVSLFLSGKSEAVSQFLEFSRCYQLHQSAN
jgi:anti-sigma B factor antagonist